nr:hypothetical protein [Brucella intermedia]
MKRIAKGYARKESIFVNSGSPDGPDRFPQLAGRCQKAGNVKFLRIAPVSVNLVFKVLGIGKRRLFP